MSGIMLGRRALAAARLTAKDNMSFSLKGLAVQVTLNDKGDRLLRTYGGNRHSACRITTTPPTPRSRSGQMPADEMAILDPDGVKQILDLLTKPTSRPVDGMNTQFVNLRMKDGKCEARTTVGDKKCELQQIDGRYPDADRLLDLDSAPYAVAVVDARLLAEMCKAVSDFHSKTVVDNQATQWLRIEIREPGDPIKFVSLLPQETLPSQTPSKPMDIFEGVIQPMALDLADHYEMPIKRRKATK